MGAMGTSKRDMGDLRLMIKPFMSFQMSQLPSRLPTPSQTWATFTSVSLMDTVKIENVLKGSRGVSSVEVGNLAVSGASESVCNCSQALPSSKGESLGKQSENAG